MFAIRRDDLSGEAVRGLLALHLAGMQVFRERRRFGSRR